MKFYYFKQRISGLSNYKDSVILIKDSWDDWYKYETTNHVKYVDGKGNVIDLGYTKIAQVNMHPEQRTANIPSEFISLPDGFFSLGQSDDYYAKICAFGDTFRQKILSSLKDVAYDASLFNKVRNLDVMIKSLMREVSSFTIKGQFSRMAKGSARLTEYNIEYTYPIRDEKPVKLSFNVLPESFPPTNIHVIIGRNNVGKTYFIKNFINAAYFPEWQQQVGVLKSSYFDTGRLRNSKTQAFANILCVSFSPFDDYSELQCLITKSSIHNEMPFSFIGLGSNDLHETIINDFITWIKCCKKSQKKLSLLEHALDVLETDPIFEKSNLKDLLFLSTDEQDENNTESIKEIFARLSSGHQVIALTLVQLIGQITERSLVVLDEPENHLHPPLLAAFIRALSELLIDRNGVAIIATHSPVVLQEVPKSCVWKINRNGEEVRANRLEVESFGATIGTLTREVFGLEVSKSGFHKMIHEEVEKGMSYEEIIDRFNNELGDEAKYLLRTLLALKEGE